MEAISFLMECGYTAQDCESFFFPIAPDLLSNTKNLSIHACLSLRMYQRRSPQSEVVPRTPTKAPTEKLGVSPKQTTQTKA